MAKGSKRGGKKEKRVAVDWVKRWVAGEILSQSAMMVIRANSFLLMCIKRSGEPLQGMYGKGITPAEGLALAESMKLLDQAKETISLVAKRCRTSASGKVF